MDSEAIKKKIAEGGLDDALTALYGPARLAAQKARWTAAIDRFTALYGGGRDLFLLSVPGRSEIAGNHTDHNLGRVMAAAVDLDIIAVAARRDDATVQIRSEGFRDGDVVDTSAIRKEDVEPFRSSALVAGVCDGFKARGLAVCGLDAYTTSDVLKGSGLSSSAAFEVMVGALLSHVAGDGSVPATELAKIAQYAENEFFGKPCGLMDQMACAVGGLITIDFGAPSGAVIEQVPFDMTAAGYSLCIVNTGGSHSDLNAEYAAIPAEMKKVAAYFGKPCLRGITREQVTAAIPALREQVGDRAVLRALHYLDENDRVAVGAEALCHGDLDTFLGVLRESGRSSFQWLQNVFCAHDPAHQGLSLSLYLSESVLAGEKAAWRVHGGGFAGTTLALMPASLTETFAKTADAAFGEGACRKLQIRQTGAVCLVRP